MRVRHQCQYHIKQRPDSRPVGRLNSRQVRTTRGVFRRAARHTRKVSSATYLRPTSCRRRQLPLAGGLSRGTTVSDTCQRGTSKYVLPVGCGGA